VTGSDYMRGRFKRPMASVVATALLFVCAMLQVAEIYIGLGQYAGGFPGIVNIWIWALFVGVVADLLLATAVWRRWASARAISVCIALFAGPWCIGLLAPVAVGASRNDLQPHSVVSGALMLMDAVAFVGAVVLIFRSASTRRSYGSEGY
jgi:fucose 4-O-acetylase-like acetyltransferase